MRCWQFGLQVLGESWPVEVLDLAAGILQLLLNLVNDSLGVITSNLLDLINDTLKILVLQAGEESDSTSMVLGDLRVDGVGSWGKETLSKAGNRVGLQEGRVSLGISFFCSSARKGLTKPSPPDLTASAVWLAFAATSLIGLR